MLSSEHGVAVDSDVVVESGPYQVRHLQMSWTRLRLLWEQISQFRTLFSDITRGDFDNFLRYVSSETTLWLEISKSKELVGVVACEGLYRIVEIDAHVVFFDRETAGKVPLCKSIVVWLFDTLPIQRITVQPPEMYYATIRLVRNIGFKHEGKKRRAVLVGGKWVDTYVFGITREEALQLSHS